MPGRSEQGNDKGKSLAWLHACPPGTLIPVEAVLAVLTDVVGAQGQAEAAPSALAGPQEPSGQSWRVLLWTVPAETRIGREELLEAVSRPRSWLYRHTAAKAEHRIPHRKLDGELVFVVGEVRAWLKAQEEIVQAGPLDGPRLAVAR